MVGRLGPLFSARSRSAGPSIRGGARRPRVFQRTFEGVVLVLSYPGGKQASSYFRQRNWVQAREAQIRVPCRLT